MALYRSLQKGQVPLSCQLCKDSIKGKWKCLDCQLLMCTDCKDKIHPKNQNTDKHKVVDIRNIAAGQSDVFPELSSINCDIHTGQLCCLYCKECQEVVCPLCIAKTHNKHDKIELSEGYDNCTGILENAYESLYKDTKKLVTDVSKLELIKKDQTSKYEEEKQKILKKENELVEGVKMKTKELLTQLETDRNNLFKSIKSKETCAEKLVKGLEVRKEQIASALTQTKQPSEVFKLAKKEAKNKTQKIKSIVTGNKSLPVFFAMETLSSNIELIYGSLKYTERRIDPNDIDIQVEMDYITDFENVDVVKCCSDGSLWVTNSTKIQNVCCQSSSLKINKTVHLFVYDMTLTPSGDLLISTLDSRLQILSPSSETPEKSHWYSVPPLVTTGVHVNKDNKVIVGAIDSGPFFPAGGPRQVIVMNMKGREKVVHYLDTDKKPLFTLPSRITTDSKNNLYIIDRLSSGSGRIVMLSARGGVRGVYTGDLDTNKYEFAPGGIVTTQSDNIIVSDGSNATLHILNSGGKCVTYLNTSDSGIMRPFSVDIDSLGMLFTGCDEQEGRKDKAKLYMVTLSGL